MTPEQILFDFGSAESLNRSQEKTQLTFDHFLLEIAKSQTSQILEKTRAGTSLRLVLSILEVLEYAICFFSYLSRHLKELEQLNSIFIFNQRNPPTAAHSDSHPCIKPTPCHP